jgi:hypothetical protein
MQQKSWSDKIRQEAWQINQTFSAKLMMMVTMIIIATITTTTLLSIMIRVNTEWGFVT